MDITTTFQWYLILSFFVCVPDRQRTVRELELSQNFIKLDGNKDNIVVCVIQHTAEDYNTATYGKRPPLPLLLPHTSNTDDYLACWQPALLCRPSKDSTSVNPSSLLFLKPHIGNPLTANSVY